MPGHNQLAELLAAERKAEALFAAIETQGLVRPGRTETEVDQDIYALAEQAFGVRKHWHKRIVSAQKQREARFKKRASASRCHETVSALITTLDVAAITSRTDLAAYARSIAES